MPRPDIPEEEDAIFNVEDPRDGDYVDLDHDLNDPSVVETTPSSRIVTLASPSLETKRRVLRLSPNHGRCLIENCSAPRAVEYCHCVPKSFTLEHDLVWFAKRELFPAIPNREDYQYTLIPLSQEMAEVAIHRQNLIPPRGTALVPANFTTYVSPFADLPPFQSHLHPRFVILEAGRKLSKNPEQYNVILAYPILAKVLQLYLAWTRAPPPEAKDDQSYDRPGGGGDDDDNNSKRDNRDDTATDGGRLRNGKYKWGGGGGSPTPGAASGSKRGRDTSLGQPGNKRTAHGEPVSRQRKNSICLSERTLIEHERAFGKGKKWSSCAVQVWFKEVLEQAPPPQISAVRTFDLGLTQPSNRSSSTMPPRPDISEEENDPIYRGDGDYVDLENDLNDPSVVETSSRIGVTLASPSLETKRRVVQFDPNHSRCLIENCFNARAVEYCHCVAKNFTLNTELNREDYKYALIPLTPRMTEIVIHRQNRTPPQDTTLASTDFITYVYPFADLPQFQSHLHPKFVILEAGRKLHATPNSTGIVVGYPILTKVMQLYSAWTSALPPEAKDDERYDRPGGGDDDDDNNSKRDNRDDTATDGGRLRNGKRYKRRGGGSPTPGAASGSESGKETSLGKPGNKCATHGGPKSRQGKNSICLSEKILIEHERTSGKEKKWSSGAVRVWFKEVLEQASPPQMSVG
ncbi:hypothetical protein Clacol_000101 [Clathrus columnatus]|uniref:Uncharacterized protein n=1 Tax=Clathrus columnatus TaxID=1419009 RepID=A0AAV4ZYA6_9AGAM|nr:hypothetical protein Clacol_000101 [Clathrus columnatus]